jgi:hypothetical protein
MVMMLPALAATNAAAARRPQNATLPAKVYHAAQIPYSGDEPLFSPATQLTVIVALRSVVTVFRAAE